MLVISKFADGFTAVIIRFERSAHPVAPPPSRFLGNGHFRLTNEWLRASYGEGGEINWAVLSTPML